MHKNIKITKNNGRLHITAFRTETKCPSCGEITTKKKTTTEPKYIIDFPVVDEEGNVLQISTISVQRFICTNSECSIYNKSFSDPLDGYLQKSINITTPFLDFICIVKTIMGSFIFEPIIDKILYDENEEFKWKSKRLNEYLKSYSDEHPLHIEQDKSHSNVLINNISAVQKMPYRQSKTDFSNFISICAEKFRHLRSIKDLEPELLSANDYSFRIKRYHLIDSIIISTANEDDELEKKKSAKYKSKYFITPKQPKKEKYIEDDYTKPDKKEKVIKKKSSKTYKKPDIPDSEFLKILNPSIYPDSDGKPVILTLPSQTYISGKSKDKNSADDSNSDSNNISDDIVILFLKYALNNAFLFSEKLIKCLDIFVSKFPEINRQGEYSTYNESEYKDEVSYFNGNLGDCYYGIIDDEINTWADDISQYEEDVINYLNILALSDNDNAIIVNEETINQIIPLCHKLVQIIDDLN